MNLPKVLRVLVVDDLVYANRDLREYMRNVIFGVAVQSDKNRMLDYVDVVFAGTPGAGSTLWQQESFDLTLIDSHFIQTQETLSGDFDHDALFVNATYQGLILFRLFKQLTEDDKERYQYRRQWAKFVVWSSLGENVIGAFQGFRPYIKSHFWSKEKGWDHFRHGIKAAVEEVICERKDAMQTLERVLTFARLARSCSTVQCDRQPWPFHSTGWKFIIRDDVKQPKYPYLIEIATDERYSWRLGRRLPNTARANRDVICLPLVPELLVKPLPDLIGYLVPNGPNTDGDNELQSSVEASISSLPSAENSAKASPQPRYPAISKPVATDKTASRRYEFLGKPFPNRFFAAATPLTGISAVGEKNAIAALGQKVQWLLRGRFGGVILKTTYLNTLDEWTGVQWPAIQAQSHMRSRCLFPDTGTATLWNTGRTALEMLLPVQVGALLAHLSSVPDLETHRVIVSLGSKYYEPGELKRGYRDTVRSEYTHLWEKLFSDVFGGVKEACFPIVEINVRHFLREIVEYYLGGDEYLNPTEVEEKCSSDVEAFWAEYALWLEAVHSVALKHQKMLILKMPHRSDTLALIRYAVSLRRMHTRAHAESDDSRYGVRAVALVNALKTPVPRSAGYAKEHSAAWYANAHAWGDGDEKTGKYQMSGAMVTPYRNQLLSAVLKGEPLRDDDLEIMVSGGVTNPQEIAAIDNIERSKKHRKTVFPIQIGTWALLRMDPATWDQTATWGTQQAPGSAAFRLPLSDLKSTCIGVCKGKCQLPGPYEKFLRRGADGKIVVIGTGDIPLSDANGAIGGCVSGKLIIVGTNTKKGQDAASCEKAITPRIVSLNEERCIACGRCLATQYCDSFIDRARRFQPPLLEPRNCTGCGLCVQVCQQGALQLYKPKDMLVLLDDRNERHDILNELGIPHLCITSSDADQIPALSDKPASWDIRTKLASVVTATTSDAGRSNLKASLLEIFSRRVGLPPGEKGCGTDSFCLRKEKEKLYAENRYDSLNKGGTFVGDMLAEGLSSIWDNRGLRETYARAAIWAMLIWSDPGQVLGLSPIIAVHTELRHTKKNLQVVNHLVVLRGRLDANGSLEFALKVVTENPQKDMTACGPIALSLAGPSFCLADLDGAKKRLYEASGYGIGRIQGLDVRGAGRFLVKDYDSLSPANRLAIAGLPWSTIEALPGVAAVVKEKNWRLELDNLA